MNTHAQTKPPTFPRKKHVHVSPAIIYFFKSSQVNKTATIRAQ